MNKIFKIVWNHATQTFTVVSELAKSHGKPSSQSTQTGVIENKTSKKFRLASLVTVLAIGLGLNSMAFAANQFGKADSASHADLGNYFNPDNLNINKNNRGCTR